MKKLILVAAMLAVALLVAAPAVMADTTQTNTGDVVATNDNEQVVHQRQYAPGGDAQYNNDDNDIDVDNEEDFVFIGQRLEPDDDFDIVIFEGGDVDRDNDVDQTGGDGGVQRSYQDSDQTATATGATFSAR